MFRIGFFLSFLLLLTSNVFAQLEDALKAHGGIELFRQYGTAEYDLRNWPLGEGSFVNDHHLIDLKSRKILITGNSYKIGFDGKDAWALPGDAKLPGPPRFYVSTPFYFFGMPFLFADSGVVQKPLGAKSLNGKQYDVAKMTFKTGVGDTPEDYYIAYFDKKTRLLHLLVYIVTYPPFREGKSVEHLDQHAIVFDEWQKVNGLLVPKKVTFYSWKKDRLGEAIVSCSFENVSFQKARPDANRFLKPAGAVVDESHKTGQ